jgi:solute carrier family 25 (mitochondrial phosphate transporter), member 23/24/25/41
VQCTVLLFVELLASISAQFILANKILIDNVTFLYFKSGKMPSERATQLVKDPKALRQVFLDSGGGDYGGLDTKEFAAAVTKLGLPERSISYVTELRTSADRDQSGRVNFEEFKSLFSLGCLRHVFDQIDTDQSGQMEDVELTAALNLLDVHLPSHQVSEMLRKIDTDNSGTISFDEFSEFFGMIPNADLQSVFTAWTHYAGIDTGTDLGPSLPPSQMPIWRFLVAGGLAGCASRTLTAPLEKIKIQAQVTGKSPGVLRSLRALAVTGGLKTAWQGNFTNCLRVFPYSGLVCVFYSQSLKVLPADDEMDAMEPVWRALGGGFAGSMATICTYPLDVVRAKLTIAEKGSNHTIMGTMRELMKTKGVRGLYGGLGATLTAVAPFVGLQQASYDVIKLSLIDSGYASPSVGFFTACGVVSGLAAQTIVYPLDVLRRRIQVEGVQSTWARLYTLPALQRVVKKEGFAGLFAGLLPTYAKVAPAVACSLVVRDAILGRLDDATFSRDERM